MTDEKDGDELVRKLAELAVKKEAEPPPELTNDVVIHLAGLTPLQYAQQLNREVKKYKTPIRLLEKAVDAARVEIEVEKLLEPHWEVEPAEDPVDAAALFRDIEARILHHLAMPKHLALVTALWIGQSWIHEHATYSPILFITSPERDSGKSTLAGVIAFLVRRSLLSVGISAAALYRSIEKWHPSFVIDEADEAFVDNPDLRQVINSGWTRGQGVTKCDPDTHEPRVYSTFCAKAIALKGKKAPDTILSRAIFVTMKRRTRAEPVADFAHVDDDGFRRLRSNLARWAADNGAALGLATPAMPDGFMNRTAANWKLMFAIADSLGGDAGDRAREAARRILGVTDATSAGVALLQDIKSHFDRSTLDYVTSKARIADLTADPEKQWAEWSRGKAITEKGVAGLLHEFRIVSKSVGPHAEAKGYRKADFDDAWARYLPSEEPQEAERHEEGESAPPISPVKRQTHCNDYGNGEKIAVNHDPGRREKNDIFENEINELDGLTGKIAPLPAFSLYLPPPQIRPMTGSTSLRSSDVTYLTIAALRSGGRTILWMTCDEACHR
jgi:putative DNA primase/helicase